MSKKELLLNKMKENNGIITTKDALSLGIHKDMLKKLTHDEEIVKVANGLYVLTNEEIDEYLYFSYRIPKGVFSHETAAYLQGLSTRMPLNYVMMVMKGDNVSRIKKNRDDISFKYSKKEYYDLGKEKIISPFGREAMKLYFGGEDKDLLKLSKYAMYMNMEEQLKPYTEVLL